MQRASKKWQHKEKWEKVINKSICERWRARTIKFQKDVQDESERLKRRDEEAAEKVMQLNEHENIKEKCMQEIYFCQEQVYKDVSDSSLKESNDALLLPSVEVVDASYPTDTQSINLTIPGSITGVDRVAVESALKLERQKTMKAYREAQIYRNLSERIRKEKRELASSYNEKIELVRDFWRNNIKEGSTRAGRMVQKALQKRHSSMCI